MHDGEYLLRIQEKVLLTYCQEIFLKQWGNRSIFENFPLYLKWYPKFRVINEGEELDIAQFGCFKVQVAPPRSSHE
jgi:hypothetical protein